jgi:hypothetical protein
MLSRSQRSFKPGDRRGLRAHAFRDLRLGQAGIVPRFQQKIEQGTFLAFNTLHLFAHRGAAQEFGDYLVMGWHV